VGEVEHEEAEVGRPVKGGRQGLEALLARRVPEVDRHAETVRRDLKRRTQN